MFSQAISSIPSCWRANSRPIAAARSGSASASGAPKKRAGLVAGVVSFIGSGSRRGVRRRELGEAAVVPPPLVPGGQESAERVQRHLRPDQAGAEGGDG